MLTTNGEHATITGVQLKIDVMINLGANADIVKCYDFMSNQCQLTLGQHWRWAWDRDCWAVEVFDPQHELAVVLRLDQSPPGGLQLTESRRDT